jgi:hypothetical protein
MADLYFLRINQINGAASLTVETTFGTSTVPSGLGFSTLVEEGTSVTVTVTLDAGFNSFSAVSARFGSPFTTSPFTFTMPSADTRFLIDISGSFAPVDGYGLKYFWEWKSVIGNEDRKLEIYEDDFSGIATEKKIQNLKLTYGNRESDVIDTFMRSSLVFDIVAKGNDFQEFMTGNNRQFQARYYHGGNLVWKGYVLTDKITAPETNTEYIVTFQAIDGQRSFDSFRFLRQITPSNRNTALGILIGALNQTFVEGRKVNISCDIYEDRMVNSLSLFAQFPAPEAVIFNDGESAEFTDGTRIENESLYIAETLKRLCNPFFVRIFLQNDEWYLVRVPDYSKPNLRFFSFNPDGTSAGLTTLTIDDQLFGCGNPKFGNAIRTSELVFNTFTTILKLGSLNQASTGGFWETKFNFDNFFVPSQGSPLSGIPILRVWQYVRMQPVLSSNAIFVGSIASLAYTSSGGEEFAEIYTTTSTSGLSDPNVSYIELTTATPAVGLQIVQENANVLSISIDYMILRVGGGSAIPGINNRFAIMVQIGNNWLSYDIVTNTFSWVGSFNVMLWTAPAGGEWNSLRIVDIPVPVSGTVQVRLYQIINTGGPINGFKLRLRNFRIDIEQNEGLANSEIQRRGVVENSKFDRIHPNYETFIGDALTANSFSAITINGEVSESWTDRDSGPLELLENQAQVLANLKGRRNLRIIGTLYSPDLPDLRKSVQYDGKNFVINYFSHDSASSQTEISLIEIQP